MLSTELTSQQKRERTLKIINNVFNLNVIPKVVFELIKALDNPRTNAMELNKLVSHDQALITKILTVANSPMYGLQRKVTTIDFAILVIGFKELKNIVAAISISDALRNKTDKYLSQKDFLLHSYMVGSAAKKIAKDIGLQNTGEAFICGFLHDIGLSIIHRYMHSSFVRVVDLMQTERLTLKEAEIEVNGITHEEVGSILLDKWNFPNEIVEPVLYHHYPSQSQSSPTMSSIINLADFMTEALKIGELYLDRGVKLDELTFNKFKFEKELDAEKFSTNYKDLFWEQMEFVRFLS